MLPAFNDPNRSDVPRQARFSVPPQQTVDNVFLSVSGVISLEGRDSRERQMVLTGVEWSGLRGSNPSSWLGKPEHYHYAKPALWCRRTIIANLTPGLKTRGSL